jgi:protoheme IX farnesyltransferase
MLPTKEKESRFTGVQCMLYSLVLIPLAMLTKTVGLTGNIGMGVGVGVGLLYFAASIVFYIKNDYKSAKRVMFASFLYLPVLMMALLLNKR